MCPWEGFNDFYREATHHGGILSTFFANWYERQVLTVQHGCGERGGRSRVTGELACGPEVLEESELTRNRADLGAEVAAHRLDDIYYADRATAWDKVMTPVSRAATGAATACTCAATSKDFWRRRRRTNGSRCTAARIGGKLYGLRRRPAKALLRPFPERRRQRLGQAAAAAAADQRPRRQLRRAARGRLAILRTRWTKLHLDACGMTLGPHAPRDAATVTYDASGAGVTFLGAPFDDHDGNHRPPRGALCITSRPSTRISSSSSGCSTRTARRSSSRGARPARPLAQGWLRASHRKLDPFCGRCRTAPTTATTNHGPRARRSRDARHRNLADLHRRPTRLPHRPDWRGTDYVSDRPPMSLSNLKTPMTGCGPFVHDDPRDRPDGVFAGQSPLSPATRTKPNWLLVPFRARRSNGLLAAFLDGNRSPLRRICSGRHAGMNDPPFTSRATPVM